MSKSLPSEKPIVPPRPDAPIGDWMNYHRATHYQSLPREHLNVLAAYLQAGFDECVTASQLGCPISDVLIVLNNIFVKDAVRKLMYEVEKAGMSSEASYTSYESMLRRAYHIAAGDVKVKYTDKNGFTMDAYQPNAATMISAAEKLYALAEKRRLDAPPPAKDAGRALPWAKREKAVN